MVWLIMLCMVVCVVFRVCVWVFGLIVRCLVCMNCILVMLKKLKMVFRQVFWKFMVVVGLVEYMLLCVDVMIIFLLLVRLIGLFFVYLNVWLVCVMWLIQVLSWLGIEKLYIGVFIMIMLLVSSLFMSVFDWVCLVWVVLLKLLVFVV